MPRGLNFVSIFFNPRKLLNRPDTNSEDKN